MPSVQSQLDEVATEIAIRQDESDQSKRTLIEQMRDFKKTQDETTRTAVAPLIKSFQNEVDNLSKRSKSAEKAFFDVYKRLADAADPVPILEHALEAQKGLSKVTDLEIEIKQLRETIGDYNQEIQEYKAKEKKMNELQAKVDAYDKVRSRFDYKECNLKTNSTFRTLTKLLMRRSKMSLNKCWRITMKSSE